MKDENIIQIKNVDKVYSVGDQDVQVLFDVNFDIKWNDFVVVFGPSGSGKSTILYTLLGLEEPTKGTVKFLGEELYGGKDEDFRSSFRKQHVGMVYQQSNWIKSLTVKENVSFPLLLLGQSPDSAIQTAIKYLDMVGMANWSDYMPTELSAGQQQRVALARAMVNNPQVIIADEPTGNLDYESGQMIMELLKKLNKEQEKTIIMVTHDLEYLDFSLTAIRIFDGRVVGTYHENDREQLYKDLKLKRGVLNRLTQSDEKDKVNSENESVVKETHNG